MVGSNSTCWTVLRFHVGTNQDSAHELNQHQLCMVCDLCIVAERAGRYASRKEKLAVDIEALAVMNTSAPGVYL